MTSNTTPTHSSTSPMPRLIDSHCHLHDSEFYDDAAREAAYQQAVQAGHFLPPLLRPPSIGW